MLAGKLLRLILQLYLRDKIDVPISPRIRDLFPIVFNESILSSMLLPEVSIDSQFTHLTKGTELMSKFLNPIVDTPGKFMAWYQHLAEPIRDALALEYCNIYNNIRIVTIYPLAYRYVDKIESVLNKKGDIIHKKSIPHNDHLISNIVWLYYVQDSWGGRYPMRSSRFFEKIGIVASGKAKRNPFTMFLYRPSDNEEVREMKEKIRERCDYGFHSIHINDLPVETRRMVRSVFSEPTLTVYRSGFLFPPNDNVYQILKLYSELSSEWQSRLVVRLDPFTIEWVPTRGYISIAPGKSSLKHGKSMVDKKVTFDRMIISQSELPDKKGVFSPSVTLPKAPIPKATNATATKATAIPGVGNNGSTKHGIVTLTSVGKISESENPGMSDGNDVKVSEGKINVGSENVDLTQINTVNRELYEMETIIREKLMTFTSVPIIEITPEVAMTNVIYFFGLKIRNDKSVAGSFTSIHGR